MFKRKKDADTTCLDMTGIPSHACPACGAREVKIVAIFDDYAPSWYATTGYCYLCNCRYTVPCEIDRQPEIDAQLEALDLAQLEDGRG